MAEPNSKEPKLDVAVPQKTEAETETKPVPEAASSACTGPGTVRKKHRVEGERICKVCGDKAVAHNFDVITCESCKTFFRRNAHKKQKECAFQGNCEITIQTRRFCPSCRLRKCFTIGMRADMILDEVERQARMEKILTNRKKRQEAAKKTQPTKDSETTTAPCTSTSFPEADGGEAEAGTDPDVVDNLLSEIAEFETHAGRRTSQEEREGRQCLRSQSSSGSEDATPGCSCPLGDKLPCLSDGRTKACNFQHVPQNLLPSDPMMYWRLSAGEHVLITELTVAYKEALLQMPTTPEALSRQLEQITLRETLKYCERFAAENITFLKRVKDFRMLDIQDQQAVLKGSAMMCLMIKSSACYSEERQAWLKDFGPLPVELFQRLTQHEDVVARYASFCRTLKRIVKNDYTAYVLINLIVLFQPQAANVLDRQKVNFYQDKYTTLLKHYLESQYSYMFAAQYLEAIQDVIGQGKIVAVDMKAMFSNWKEFLAPLMREVINLT